MTQRQIALVTGSTSGIGLGIAVSLAQAGYRLILNGFGEPEVIDQAVADVAAVSASPPIYVGTDLTRPQAIETALAEIIASEGPISVLVNNAGTQFTAPIDAFPIEKWDQIKQLRNIKIKGLMTINPKGLNSAENLKLFKKCRKLADSLKLDDCSMGMSGDWEEAVEAGSTWLRLGSIIFRERSY